ncbi:MAG: zinc ribbon domain-containing protein, partial [Firmicutes bacterium]|nr:zinc ribbon domain-containing protein [Bacillota bacterium]
LIMYCNKCGAEVNDGNAFCTNCGSPLNKAKIEFAERTEPKEPQNFKIKCIRCRSCDLHPLTEDITTSKTTGSDFSVGKGCLGYLLMGPFGILCGACGKNKKTTTTTTHKNYWVCKDCGFKFKDLATLETEINTYKSSLILTSVALIFWCILMIYMIISFNCTAFLLICLAIGIVIGGINFFSNWTAMKNAQEEYDNTKRIFME